MKECVIVGRPNTGKTLFALNFAGYLGSKVVDITCRSYDDLITCRHLTIDQAKKELCGMTMHKTRSLQSIILKVPVGKTQVAFKLTDTCGLSEGIHNEEDVRRGMAQTIKLLRYADFILHIVDLTTVNREGSIIDREIYQFGVARHNYLLLGNKIDLPAAKENFTRLSSLYPQANALPVSALYNLGFKEVKAYVARNV
ncbi:MAG: GTPase domain-containing protein [Negativicutes bacterium]|nr:GTPase domain-containing protein [Negativicutes bacterium]